ncbi:hypothetical protein KCP73_10500 [Salmonella enterica subsp. enterica]|nr:hypothetical protein KCP73_10500 [Salmonella enterica subsp. enterica]
MIEAFLFRSEPKAKASQGTGCGDRSNRGDRENNEAPGIKRKARFTSPGRRRKDVNVCRASAFAGRRITALWGSPHFAFSTAGGAFRALQPHAAPSKA